MKLAQKAVDLLDPGDRRIVWDDGLAGFGVRVTEGSVAFVVDFHLGKQRRRVTLAPVSHIRLDKARARALEILVAARRSDDLTVNPRLGMPVFEAVWRDMIDNVDKPKLSPVTIADYEDRARRHILPRIGQTLIGDVTHGGI